MEKKSIPQNEEAGFQTPDGKKLPEEWVPISPFGTEGCQWEGFPPRWDGEDPDEE